MAKTDVRFYMGGLRRSEVKWKKASEKFESQKQLETAKKDAGHRIALN